MSDFQATYATLIAAGVPDHLIEDANFRGGWDARVQGVGVTWDASEQEWLVEGQDGNVYSGKSIRQLLWRRRGIAVAKPDEEAIDRRGRPEIGSAIHIRLGDLLPRVDDWAQEHGTSRAEAIRRLITAGLQA